MNVDRAFVAIAALNSIRVVGDAMEQVQQELAPHELPPELLGCFGSVVVVLASTALRSLEASPA